MCPRIINYISLIVLSAIVFFIPFLMDDQETCILLTPSAFKYNCYPIIVTSGRYVALFELLPKLIWLPNGKRSAGEWETDVWLFTDASIN